MGATNSVKYRTIDQMKTIFYLRFELPQGVIEKPILSIKVDVFSVGLGGFFLNQPML